MKKIAPLALALTLILAGTSNAQDEAKERAARLLETWKGVDESLVGTIHRSFTPGSVEMAGISSDLAVEGAGFFVLR